MLKGFRDFITRGNVIDLAVGIIIGAAFTPIIEAISDLLMTIIAGLVGEPDFDNVWTLSVGGAQATPGTILTALVNFLLIAAALYFFVVLPMNKWHERQEARKEEEPAEADTNELLGQIRDLLAANAPGTGGTGKHSEN